VEHDGREVPAAGGVARSHNVVYVMPHDWASVGQFLTPLVARVEDGVPDLQALVVTSSVELAAEAAAAAVRVVEDRFVTVTAATAARRAARLLRIRPVQVLVGTPDTLLELVRGTVVKLDAVREVCIAWADELVTTGALASLEALMADVPKDAGRTVVAAELTPAVEELLERYARRARRVVAPASQADEPVHLSYMTVSPRARLEALRRVLDELDPRSAMVFAREDQTEKDVRSLLRALGYAGPDAAVTAGVAAPPGTDLAVLYDLPASRGELREACSAAARTVALVQPRQLASLRAMAGGTVSPLTLTDAGARARERDARAREELRGLLARGEFGRELLSLEPLLDEFDGVEIAAAALQLLERERAAAAHAVTPAAQPAPTRERESGPMVRLFVNVGARDQARPGDLMGAITNQAGVDGSAVGRIDVRESHSTVEVSAAVADVVIDRVTGTSIRGRRAVVRRDEERPRRDTGDRPPGPKGRGPRPGAGGGRDRGFTRGAPPRARGPRRGPDE